LKERKYLMIKPLSKMTLASVVLLGLLSTPPVYAEEPFAERITFTLPPQMKEVAKVLEDAGIDIVYGPNSVPAPEGISDEAKKMWAQLPQLPLQGHDAKKLAAVRKMTAIGEKAAFDKLSKIYTIEDREINGVMAQWTTPTQLTHKDKVMIFIHGGGMVVDTRKTQLSLQVDVANSLGVKVVSIEYPLAPEHPYPAAVNDIVKAYQGIIKEYGAENAGLLGTSAGGVTLATLLRLKADGLALPAASAPISPEADMTASGFLFKALGLNDPVLPPYGTYTGVRAYDGKADGKDPLVSPVFGDYTGVTPIFLFSGTSELLGSDAIRIAANARSQGCDVTLYVNDGMWHVSIGNGTGVPELQQPYDEMIRFFKQHLAVYID
jgi:monoterpene epsilon-lactone hydrolase